MKIEDLTKYLNQRANGMRCPICGEFDWYVNNHGGNVKNTNLADGGTMEELTQALSELIIENGGTPPSEDNLEENPRKGILSSCIMLRCNHCGHLEFFDRLFVEDQIHGKK